MQAAPQQVQSQNPHPPPLEAELDPVELDELDEDIPPELMAPPAPPCPPDDDDDDDDDELLSPFGPCPPPPPSLPPQAASAIAKSPHFFVIQAPMIITSAFPHG